MTVTSETVTEHTILALARRLPADRRRWVAEWLSREHDAPLPEHATLDEAIALYLLDACSLGRAAELAGVTRWEIQDRLRTWSIPIPIPGDQSAQAMDDFAAQLEREGIL